MNDSTPNAPPTTGQRLRRALRGLALLAALASGSAAAIDPDDLLPVDQAFALSASGSANGVDITWRIAEGYYLYRHRTSASADSGLAAGALQLPDGTPYRDEFFGDVETYRGSLAAHLPGEPRAASTTVTIKYQGCADAGICYPPQTRTVDVALPAPTAAAATGMRLSVPGAGGNQPLLAEGVGTTPLLGALGGRDEPLPPERAFGVQAIAADGNTLLLRFTPAPGYYLYRDNTTLALQGDGITAGTPRWPAGTDHEDEFFGRTVVYFEPVDVPLPLLRTSPEAQSLRLSVGFQGCQTDGICYPPMTRALEVEVPAGTVSTAATAPPPAAGAGTPASPGSTDPATPAAAPAQVSPAARPGDAPVAGISADATGVAAPGAEAGPGLLSALLLAVLGGLILNLMPCVLPVLSLKALSLAGHAHDSAGARRSALAYTAGVLLSFAALGALALVLRQAGLALGWGFQLQHPLVVALLALLMFALGLSLSGVWHVGGRWTGAGHGLATRSGPAGDFFTGVLAVVVATPCTAPFMGAALAWAFTASPGVAMAVFLALGLGLALPFLLIGFIPALARLLPRPGAWMDTFKQVLAFPLYLTAAWLAWVLANQRGADAIGWWMVAAVLLAFAAWAWTRSRMGAGRWAGAAAVLALLATAWPLRVIHELPRPVAATTATADEDGLVAVPYSAQRLADLRAAGRVVFVNMTADWCVTCKANERTVLSRDGFRDAMVAADAVYMVGDWTDVDPAIGEFLRDHDAVGVPFYVVFPPGGGEGRVLPTVLTLDIARQALGNGTETGA